MGGASVFRGWFNSHVLLCYVEFCFSVYLSATKTWMRRHQTVGIPCISTRKARPLVLLCAWPRPGKACKGTGAVRVEARFTVGAGRVTGPDRPGRMAGGIQYSLKGTGAELSPLGRGGPLHWPGGGGVACRSWGAGPWPRLSTAPGVDWDTCPFFQPEPPGPHLAAAAVLHRVPLPHGSTLLLCGREQREAVGGVGPAGWFGGAVGKGRL